MTLGAAITRWLVFFALWAVVAGGGILDLVVGAPSAALAAWISLVLLPAASRPPRAMALARLVARFVWQSVLAGGDVAWRALHPALPLQPGYRYCPLRLGPGPLRSAFCAISSLLPGTLVAGSEPDGALCMHCLDAGQDVPAQMRAEEAAFRAAAGIGDG